MRQRATASSVLSVLITGIVLGGCSSAVGAERPTGPQSVALEIPLATSAEAAGPSALAASASGASAWAIVPFGDSAAPSWQLFALGGPQASWSRVTPPGVADEGGLVGSFLPTGAVVGIEASGLLAFSPVATTHDGGLEWSPGILPTELAPVPDALAATGGGGILALLGQSGSTIVESGDNAVTTSVLTSRLAVAAAAGGSCDLTALTAVAYGPAGQPMVGGRCYGSARVGIFEQVGTGWELVGPLLPAAAVAGGITTRRGSSATGGAASAQSLISEVLQLSSDAGQLVALIESVARDGTATVLRLSRSASGSWSSSPAYDVAPSERLMATGVAPDGSSFVVMSHSGGSVTADVLGAAGSSWNELPALPAGTATLVLEVAGTTESLAVEGATLTVSVLGRSGAWSAVQVIRVPT